MISVCYCGNRRVFPGLLLSVLSLAKHTERAVHVYVLSMDLHEQNAAFLPFTEGQIGILNEVLREKNPESRAEQIDMTAMYKERLAHGKNRKAAIYTPYALLRLFLDRLPGLPEKMVYLDIDTMCAGDIAQLFDTDVSGYEYAAVRDFMGKFWIDKNYCNSGVLLLNLPMIRETGLFERVRDLVCTKKMAMPDQSALHLCGTKRLYLPERFNEQRGLKQDTVVKHCCKGIKWILFIPLVYNIKQWQREKVHKRLKIRAFDDLYERYDELAAEHPEEF